MKAYQIAPHFGLENLKPVSLPDPKPGPHQVLIEIKACSLNYRDLLMVRGEYNPKQPLPLIPLSDGVGHVVQIGDGVTRVKVGDRVVGNFAQGWICGPATKDKVKTTLGSPIDGMLAQLIVLHEDGVSPVPAYLSDVEAATLPCAALTAWHALVEKSCVKPGESVLLLGTGGVSLFALQFAKLLGAQVVITSSDDAKLAKAKQIGADHIINYKTHPEWSKKVRELFADGVDHVVEVGGAVTFGQSLLSVKMGGQINLIGRLGGRSAEIDFAQILMRQIRVQGVFVGHREWFESMCRAIEHHQLKPVVDRVFDFEETVSAFKYLESGKHFGKICIRVSK